MTSKTEMSERTRRHGAKTKVNELRPSEKREALRKLGFSGAQIIAIIEDGWDEQILNDALAEGLI